MVKINYFCVHVHQAILFFFLLFLYKLIEMREKKDEQKTAMIC